MIGTRNCKARNERSETGALVKNRNGRNVSVERKVGECFEWKATGQCSKGDSCSFSYGSYSGQKSTIILFYLKKADPDRRKEALKKWQSKRSESFRIERQKACKQNLKGKCTEPSCDLWHPPVCRNYMFESGCKYGDRSHFRHTEAGASQLKVKEKCPERISGRIERKYSIGLCVPRIALRKKSILREIGKLCSNHTVKFSKTTTLHAKIRQTEGPSQVLMPKCVLQDRIPWAPKFEERTQDETLKQERCARRDARDLGQGCL